MIIQQTWHSVDNDNVPGLSQRCYNNHRKAIKVSKPFKLCPLPFTSLDYTEQWIALQPSQLLTSGIFHFKFINIFGLSKNCCSGVLLFSLHIM